METPNAPEYVALFWLGYSQKHLIIYLEAVLQFYRSEVVSRSFSKNVEAGIVDQCSSNVVFGFTLCTCSKLSSSTSNRSCRPRFLALILKSVLLNTCHIFLSPSIIMTPPIETFPASELPYRIQCTLQGRRRKSAIDLEECKLSELVQYSCYLDGNQGSLGAVIKCEPIVRLFRR